MLNVKTNANCSCKTTPVAVNRLLFIPLIFSGDCAFTLRNMKRHFQSSPDAAPRHAAIERRIANVRENKKLADSIIPWMLLKRRGVQMKPN